MGRELTKDELDMVSGGGSATEGSVLTIDIPKNYSEPPSIPKYQAPAVKKAQASQQQYHATTPNPDPSKGFGA